MTATNPEGLLILNVHEQSQAGTRFPRTFAEINFSYGGVKGGAKSGQVMRSEGPSADFTAAPRSPPDTLAAAEDISRQRLQQEKGGNESPVSESATRLQRTGEVEFFSNKRRVSVKGATSCRT